MDTILRNVRRFIPKVIFNTVQPYYHYGLALLGAIRFGFPSRKITVIGITGTKGKSTVTELIAAILRADGKSVASLSTIQFTYGEKRERNLFKMTMPGRFFVQQFLRRAVNEGCEYAVMEMTSEGAKLYRHKFVELDALVFTNLTPEHIESHGSFANYKAAKLRLADAVAHSKKRPRILVANADDEHGADFLAYTAEKKISYSLKDLNLHTLHRDGVSLVFGDNTVRVPLVGLFNVYNALAAIKTTQSFGVSLETAARALRNLPPIAGRVEHFESPATASKRVTAIVDYAHTTDSLEKLYQAFPDRRKICVLGNTGGGRDTWKRPEMATIAEKYCEHIFLTNEDPYDENPRQIVADMEKGIEDKEKLTVIMDRKEAIRAALARATNGDLVIVSGKGTDPYIMGPLGQKTPWSDAGVVKETLKELAETT
jgi:UDP-N-acetylmuramoyl-L-alanyl-D-glutamate--2,6-diaminopimelate ligase